MQHLKAGNGPGDKAIHKGGILISMVVLYYTPLCVARTVHSECPDKRNCPHFRGSFVHFFDEADTVDGMFVKNQNHP